MSLSDDYQRQRAWRPWAQIFAALPAVEGQTVLDLGCGVGDQMVELAARGAHVIGVDGNEQLLHTARARNIRNAEFRLHDLRTAPDLAGPVHGIWSSFAAAYFPDLTAWLAVWSEQLRPGGWIALTEIDDLFGHEPVSGGTKALFEAYAREALAAGRYDFHMGRRLRGHLERSGFTVSTVLRLDDEELAFTGPARGEVVEAWRTRLDRMQLLRNMCGSTFEQVRDEFLGCLRHAEHRSTAKVYCCVATKGGEPRGMGQVS